MKLPDVDIDVRDRTAVVSSFQMIPGSQLSSDGRKLISHKTGVYFQNIPVDPVTGLSAFPYDVAEKLGYYKIDFLVNHVYDQIETPSDLEFLLAMPIDWSWFLDQRFYQNDDRSLVLTHLGEHYEVVQQYPPGSIEDIAILLALIRPAKKHLIGLDWDAIRESIWLKDAKKGYAFKKSHAFSFAMLVMLHAKLIAIQLGLAG